MFARDYKKHIWMVQVRDTELQIADYIKHGRTDLIEREWTDALVSPVWHERARFHARDNRSQWTETRIIRVA